MLARRILRAEEKEYQVEVGDMITFWLNI